MMQDPAKIEQELQAQKTPQVQAGSPAPGHAAGEPQMSPEVQQMIQHLDSLPEEQKAFFAQYLSPETAKCYGILLGDQQAYEYFANLADPNITLIPVPRDALEGQMNSSEGNPQAMQPAGPQQQMQAPAQPSAQMPMVNKPPMGDQHM